jgi:hypothetical protein
MEIRKYLNKADKIEEAKVHGKPISMKRSRIKQKSNE